MLVFNLMPDDLILLIFKWCGPRDLLQISFVNNRLRKLTLTFWNSVVSLNFAHFFIEDKFATGRELNQGLNWALSKCGRNLKALSFDGYEPENSFIRVNTRTFKIIGHFCEQLEVLIFNDIEMLNDHLHDLVKYINCDNMTQLEFDGSFNHQCPIHDGLTNLYERCRKLQILNISNSLNARPRDCQAFWPPNLKKLSMDHATAMTSYSLFSLTMFCPSLEYFSMNDSWRGMEQGIHYICDRMKSIKEMHLRDVPGKVGLWLQLAKLNTLTVLDLAGCPEITDTVIETICYNCASLLYIDISCSTKSPSSENVADSKWQLTDAGLKAISMFTPKLQVLKVNRRQLISDMGVKLVIEQKSLKELSMHSCTNISDATLNFLYICCHALTKVDVSGTSITEEGLANFGINWLDSQLIPEAHQPSYALYLFLYNIDFKWHTVTRDWLRMSLNDKYVFISKSLLPRRVLTLDY